MGRIRPARPDSPATVVLRLSREIAGLSRAQRSRSVIEQAKGVLMARLNCSADRAFEQLTRISQETNTKVAEVAAGLLGLTAPDPASDQEAALADREVARYHLACAAMAAAGNGDAVAEALLNEGLRPLGAAGVLVAVREPDDTVRLVGSYGLPRGLVSSWQRLPSGLKVGFLTAAAEGRPLWLTRDEAHRAGLELFGAYAFRACLPLRRGDQVFGVAVAVWPDDPGLDLTGRALVTALAAAAGRRLRQLMTAEHTSVAASAAHWLEAVLEALPGSFALLCPVTDATGAVVDWHFDKCSPQARDAKGHTAEELVGRRLLELHPQLAGSDLLRGYEDVLRSGLPYTHGPAREPLAVLEGSAATTIWIRAARLGDGILVTWRHDDRRTALMDRIRFLQAAGPAGWARWNRQNGEIEWARENAAVLGRPRPVTIEDLPECADEPDRGRLAKAVLRVMHEQTGAELVFRAAGGGRAIPVRAVLEPIVDRRGRLTEVAAAFAPLPGRRDPDLGSAVLPTAPAHPAPLPMDDDVAGRAADDARALAGTVRHLQDRLERLRHEQQTRAVVDRARGLLSARRGCSLDAALEHLGAVARERGASLLEVAADVVGAPRPVGADEPAAAETFRPEIYLASATTSSAPAVASADSLAESLLGAAGPGAEADAVVLGVLEPDGAVRLVGSYGLPAELVGAWRRTPGSLNVPYLRAVATDRPLWLTREEAAAHDYQLLGTSELRACVPLHENGRIFGVAAVLWSRPADLDAEGRNRVIEAAEAAAPQLSALLRSAPGDAAASPAAHWAQTILAALPPCYALLRPVRDEAGEVADWCFEICSPGTVDVAGRRPEEMVGRRLNELYPHVLTAGIAEAYRQAMQAGTSATWGPAEFDIETAQGPLTVTMSGRASKFGGGILIHWRREEQETLDRRLRLLERATRGGWAEWSLSGGETVWSEEVFDLLRRDPRRGPVKLGALHRYVVPEDEPAMTDAVRRLTRLRRPVDLAVRLRRQGVVIPVRFAARPVLDQHGHVSGVRAFFQRSPE